MDNLLKTLLEMDDSFELINVEMVSDFSWKVEADKFEPSRVPSPHSFSPAPSFESFYPSLPHVAEVTSSPPGDTHFLQSSPQSCAIEENYTPSRRSQGLIKTKMSGKRRMKASEREKLRMRRLASALHTLRSFLPPIYSQRGQTLTKIQTLHCAIRYISELSSLLAQGRRRAGDAAAIEDCWVILLGGTWHQGDKGGEDQKWNIFILFHCVTGLLLS
ncbi:mesogenin-1 [Heterodontus francisci]|uniref:mesogenin-1 n=1 Tax=Heterodontus francisci TaxID=7792 RepID=UPI00355C9479